MKQISKAIGLIFLMATGQITSGQTTFNYKDDFKKILSQTKDPGSNLSYNNLIKRFAANDTLLTDFDVLALLIGFTDKPEFKPYEDMETEQKIYDINGDGNYQEALELANLFLKTHPLSVKVLYEKSYSYHKLDIEDSAASYAVKGNRIFKAMNFSGNGKSPETPIFALGPADGQDYIHKFIGSKTGGAGIGMMGSGRDKNKNFLDILEVVPKNGSPAYKLYFIIQHSTDKMFSEAEMKLFNDSEEVKK